MLKNWCKQNLESRWKMTQAIILSVTTYWYINAVQFVIYWVWDWSNKLNPSPNPLLEPSCVWGWLPHSMGILGDAHHMPLKLLLHTQNWEPPTSGYRVPSEESKGMGRQGRKGFQSHMSSESSFQGVDRKEGREIVTCHICWGTGRSSDPNSLKERLNYEGIFFLFCFIY